MTEYLPLILFALVFFLILLGYPVAFTLGGVSVLVGLWVFDIDFFYLLSLRIYGIMGNFVLLAVPLFVFMGVMMEKSGIAEQLLNSMALLLGKVKGGLAISVILVGAILGASTGIVGATVVTMGLISLPTMLKKGYPTGLSTGVIASSGTLGQIIPPSVVLVLLGTVLNVSVGDLFVAAVIPSISLVSLYVLYVVIFARLKPALVPVISNEDKASFKAIEAWALVKSFLFPFLLVASVLGSIFMGVASPTEAAGVGAFGACILSVIQGRFNWAVLQKVSKETTLITSMVFMILIGATAFSLVFRGLEGDKFFLSLIQDADLSPKHFLLWVMAIVFISGFLLQLSKET